MKERLEKNSSRIVENTDRESNKAFVKKRSSVKAEARPSTLQWAGSHYLSSVIRILI